jgi:phage repressor protein C with HTH and peptisase S24 domain
MLPAFKPGHLVVASGLYRKLRRGDVVIIGHGGLEKIKRITGMSNDLIFVEGDNPAHSTDSRSFGWLQASAVVAKVIWPK